MVVLYIRKTFKVLQAIGDDLEVIDSPKEFVKIPLYDDENIFYENRLTTGEEIGSIFNDATNSFTIPADDTTNDLFDYIFEIGSFNSFNTQRRIDAYIEFNTIPFRFGSIQLEGFQKKDGLINNYKITFYGNLIQLDDLFGEDTLQDIFSTTGDFDLRWNVNNIRDLLSLPIAVKNRNNLNLNSEVIIPLILVKEVGENTDITTVQGAITPNNVRPAIRTRNIINRIQNRYNINFESDFFDKPEFQNLYTWLNGSEEVNTEPQLITNLPQPNLNIENDPGSFTIGGVSDEVLQINLSNDFIQSNIIGVTDLHRIVINLFFESITVNNNTIPYRLRIKDLQGNILTETDEFTGNQSVAGVLFQNQNRFTRNFNFRPVDNLDNFTDNFILEVISNIPLELNITYFIQAALVRPNPGVNPNVIFFEVINSKLVETNPILTLKDNLPDISVKDFFTNILKQNNLIIRPTSSNSFIIENITDYYSRGNIIDITEFVDLESIEGKREELKRRINFTYSASSQEPNLLLGGEVGNFTLDNKINNKESTDIDVVFEYPIFVPQINPVNNSLGNTELNIALYTDYQSQVINFYYNGLVRVDSNEEFTIKLNLYGHESELTVITLSDTSDSQEFLQVRNELNFDPKNFNFFHSSNIANNIFKNNWEDYLNALYRNKQILLDVKAFIDWNTIEELDLNSEIIIGNEKYLIQDYKINLVTSETEFTLFPTYISKFSRLENGLSNRKLNFNFGGGYSSFTVRTNQFFSVEVLGLSTEWLTLFKTNGTGVTEIPIKVNENILSQPRDLIIRVNIGSDTFDIDVRQDGAF